MKVQWKRRKVMLWEVRSRASLNPVKQPEETPYTGY